MPCFHQQPVVVGDVMWCDRCGALRTSEGWMLRYSDRAKRIAALGGKGILNVEDVTDLDEGCARVLMLMRDGAWHSAPAVIEASGQREGLRRMRELREAFDIEKRRVEGKREWEYRLTEKEVRV